LLLGSQIIQPGLLLSQDPDRGAGARELAHLSQINHSPFRADSRAKHAPDEPGKHVFSLHLPPIAVTLSNFKWPIILASRQFWSMPDNLGPPGIAARCKLSRAVRSHFRGCGT